MNPGSAAYRKCLRPGAAAANGTAGRGEARYDRFMAAQTGAVSVAVSVVVRNGSRVLLVREAKPDVYGLWNLPGGRLERDETALAGAIREVKEETGLTVTLDGLLGIWTGPGWMRIVLTSATDPEPAASARPGDEILEVSWLGPTDLNALGAAELHPLMDAVIPRIVSRETFPLALMAEHTFG